MFILRKKDCILHLLLHTNCVKNNTQIKKQALMSSFVINDPVSFRKFHALQHPSSNLPMDNKLLPFIGKVMPKVDPCNGYRINRNGSGFGGGLVVTGCFDSFRKSGGDMNIIDNNNNNYTFQKPHALAKNPQLTVRQLEIGIEAEKDGGGRLVNGHKWGSTIGFPNQNFSKKIVVAVDVDEVLGSFVSALNIFIADRYSSNHSVSEYHVYEFFKIWNCSRDEADIRVHEFFKTPYFKKGIHPIPGAWTALHKLSRFCDFSVVTSRQNVIKDHTIEWIGKHYPGLFQEIHFGNHFALDGQSKPKSEICRSLGAEVLIDDNPKYAIECAEVGIKVLLFDYENSYPWCKTDATSKHPLVTKVHNWEEVEKQLVGLVVS